MTNSVRGMECNTLSKDSVFWMAIIADNLDHDAHAYVEKIVYCSWNGNRTRARAYEGFRSQDVRSLELPAYLEHLRDPRNPISTFSVTTPVCEWGLYPRRGYGAVVDCLRPESDEGEESTEKQRKVPVDDGAAPPEKHEFSIEDAVNKMLPIGYTTKPDVIMRERGFDEKQARVIENGPLGVKDPTTYCERLDQMMDASVARQLTVEQDPPPLSERDPRETARGRRSPGFVSRMLNDTGGGYPNATRRVARARSRDRRSDDVLFAD